MYGEEPLPADHPLRSLPNVVLTPHLGYCTHEVYAQFHRESVENVLAFLDGKPMRVLNPEVQPRSVRPRLEKRPPLLRPHRAQGRGRSSRPARSNLHCLWTRFNEQSPGCKADRLLV